MIDLGKKHLTLAEQKLVDERMVFELASCMMDTYTGILTKNNAIVVAQVNRVGGLLKEAPTFLARFQGARAAVAEALARQAKANHSIDAAKVIKLP